MEEGEQTGPKPEEMNVTPPPPPEPDQTETEKSPEEVEAEKAAMEKVMDIDTFGIGLHVCDRKELAPILNHGILGKGESSPIVTKQSWAKDIKERGPLHVFANIIGESQESERGQDVWGKKLPKPEIGGLHYISHPSTRFIILFDKNYYKQEPPGREGDKQKSRTYRADQRGMYDDRYKFPTSEYGYHFANRIPPKIFRGIVFKKAKSKSGLEEKYYEQEIEEDDVQALNGFVQEIIQIQYRSIKRPDMANPIYDIHGKLWWPRQMTYEQVKQFVAERDAKKKEQETGESEDGQTE